MILFIQNTLTQRDEWFVGVRHQRVLTAEILCFYFFHRHPAVTAQHFFISRFVGSLKICRLFKENSRWVSHLPFYACGELWRRKLTSKTTFSYFGIFDLREWRIEDENRRPAGWQLLTFQLSISCQYRQEPICKCSHQDDSWCRRCGSFLVVGKSFWQLQI